MWRAALIGCGSLGETHAEMVEQIDGIEMVAFCDVVEERSEEYCERFGGEYATTEVDEVVHDDSVDAVYICTLHDTHADFSIRAVENGKHVMVEKPLALTVEECLDVGRAVEENDVILMAAFKMRYYAMIEKVRELIPDPLVVSMQMMDNRWPDDLWANDPVKGGGNVLSQGVHSCDLLRYVAGSDPVSVAASGDNYYQAEDVIDNMAAVYQFEDGTTGNLLQGDCNCPPETSKIFLQAFAENRSATVSDRLCSLTYKEAGSDPVTYTGEETGFLEENRAFVDALDAGDPAPIDHYDGLYATLMILRGFDAIKTNEVQQFDLEGAVS